MQPAPPGDPSAQSPNLLATTRQDDRVGRIVGLVLSCLFVCSSLYFIATDTFQNASDTSIHMFWAFFIILSGPIASFFISNMARFDIKTPIGKGVLVGGYAVSVITFVLVNYMAHDVCPPPGAMSKTQEGEWRTFSVNNMDLDAQVINLENMTGPGDLYIKETSCMRIVPNTAFSFACQFSKKTDEVTVRIDVMEGKDAHTRFKTTLKREGREFDNLILIDMEVMPSMYSMGTDIQ